MSVKKFAKKWHAMKNTYRSWPQPEEGRPANSEMAEGFRDGYDPTAPEPSTNRSASYRHGFTEGDKAKMGKGLGQ